MRQVAVRGRRVWGLAGLAVSTMLAVPGGWLITTAGMSGGPPPQRTVIRVVTVQQPVTTVSVQGDGAPVQVTAGPVRRVRVTETITYNPQDGGVPYAVRDVSAGLLTLVGACAQPSDCTVGFAVTVPPGVSVAADTEGGPLTVSGAANANLDSGGAPVRATGISGHLVVTTDDGSLVVSGLTGPLVADTGGGPLLATNIDSPTATVITGGGEAQIGFAAPPDGLFVGTNGGPATLTLPGGPYALTADTYGGPETVGIATDGAAGRSITVTTGGGSLQIEPPKASTPPG